MRMYEPARSTRGHFGPYGGIFVAETLIARARRAARAYARYREDPRVPRRVRATS